MPILRRGLMLGAAAAGWGLQPRATFAGSPPHAAGNGPRPPPLLLARLDTGALDPARCLVSEKFDGVRAHWDGATLRHRSGRTVGAPAWFTARLPARPLDGELWLGRGRFDALSAIVRADPAEDASWRQVRYLVFELPDAPGTFAERAQAIERLAEAIGWPQLEAVAQSPVADRAALRRRLDDTVAHGGEGLMLHLASAPYVVGRSEVLCKLKPHLDAEATVIGRRTGKGKYQGDAGSLEVETPEGRRFRLGAGLPDGLRRDPPRIGSVVTYRYQALTANGLPRFARLLRVHEAF
jgi:DNA ligase-1